MVMQVPKYKRKEKKKSKAFGALPISVRFLAYPACLTACLPSSPFARLRRNSSLRRNAITVTE